MCLALLLLLTSCSLLAQTPPERAVELAITQQLSRTQQTLAQNLGMLAQQNLEKGVKPNFKIDSITVQRREQVTDLNQFEQSNIGQTVNEVYKVSGTFDATLATDNLKKQQKDSPFEVFLGREVKEEDPGNNPVETWYFIQP